MVYLMYHINFMDISIWVTGIDQKKLNRANLDTIPIALPPIELQEQFADFVNQVYKSKVVHYIINRTLQIIGGETYENQF